jgi:Fe-S cluster assembly scaffold protein SufB
MDKITSKMLETVADLHGVPKGAYNIRLNGESAERRSTENIIIQSKKDKPGIDITVKSNTKNESIHIPVVLTETGLDEVVYNHFEIGENADVLIVAGCGIHNPGDQNSEHDGVHTFHIGENARVRYVEKHYGQGEGAGEKVLNPVTVVEMEKGAYCEMELTQIEGVDSTMRDTKATLKEGAKLVVTEKLMTHGKQTAQSDMTVNMDGKDPRPVRRDHHGQRKNIGYSRDYGQRRGRADRP